MSPVLVVAFGLVLAGVAGLFVPRVIERMRLARGVQRLRSDSGRDAGREDLARVADYHRRVLETMQGATIDDATWTDLDLDAVFASLDYTQSQVGRQYLYHLLRSPQQSAQPLVMLEQASAWFAGNEREAESVRAELQRLADPRAAHLVTLLFGAQPTRPRGWWAFPALTITAVACLFLSVVWPKALVVWLAVCAANVGVQLFYRPRVRAFVTAYQAIPALVRVAQRLGEARSAALTPELTVLREGGARLAMLRRTTSWLLFEPGPANEVASTIYEYLNLLFLFDINAFVFSANEVSASRELLRRMYEAVGRIDATQSIARWRQTLPQWSTPEFISSGKALHADGIYHPLVETPVANSIEVAGTSVLVTGSNMAGKSTFVRALGVNAILAQTLHTACATRWRAPFLHVRTSIGRADSLLEGKSYYLAEVESVRTLLQAKSDARQHLFLLDELYRGTNTAERVAAAYAVLAHLTRGEDIVVVATHDLELIELLGSSYSPYHFREHVSEESLSFDFVIRAGPSSTRNAIALLKLMDYPDDVVAAALGAVRRKEAREDRTPEA